MDRTRMQRDAEAQAGRKALLLPGYSTDQLGEPERELARRFDPVEDEVERVAPGVLHDRCARRARDQLGDRAEEVLDEAGGLAVLQPAELDRVGEEDRHDTRGIRRIGRRLRRRSVVSRITRTGTLKVGASS